MHTKVSHVCTHVHARIACGQWACRNICVWCMLPACVPCVHAVCRSTQSTTDTHNRRANPAKQYHLANTNTKTQEVACCFFFVFLVFACCCCRPCSGSPGVVLYCTRVRECFVCVCFVRARVAIARLNRACRCRVLAFAVCAVQSGVKPRLKLGKKIVKSCTHHHHFRRTGGSGGARSCRAHAQTHRAAAAAAYAYEHTDT